MTRNATIAVSTTFQAIKIVFFITQNFAKGNVGFVLTNLPALTKTNLPALAIVTVSAFAKASFPTFTKTNRLVSINANFFMIIRMRPVSFVFQDRNFVGRKFLDLP